MTLTPEQLIALRATPAPSGNRIRTAMQMLGLTQAILSDHIDESQPYISDVARGRYQTITLVKARKFAEYFGCAIEDLFPAPSALVAVDEVTQ